jgi:hypothetical protein
MKRAAPIIRAKIDRPCAIQDEILFSISIKSYEPFYLVHFWGFFLGEFFSGATGNLDYQLEETTAN